MTDIATAPVPASSGGAAAEKSLWRHRDFLLLWGGQTVSEYGDQISRLALPLLAVTVIGATTFEVSVIGLLGSLAFLLLALPAGVVVDRTAKLALMLWCDVARTAVVASIPLAAVLWHVTLWQLYAVAGVAGILSVFFDVSYQSYLPVLVGRDRLVDGNSKLTTTQELARVTGPSAAGVLIGLLGAARTVLGDAVSFAVSALSLALIRTRETRHAPEPGAQRVGFRAAMGEGLGFVLRDPILRHIVGCTATSNFFGQAESAISIVFLVRTLHASAAVVGLVLGLGAVGGLLGGLIAKRLAARFGSARVIWLAMALPGPLYLLQPLAQPGWGVTLFVIGEIGYSAMAIVYNIGQISYRQAICPPELLGRMNASVRWIVWGTIPFGALFGGALGTWIGLRATMWVCSLGLWGACLWLVFSPLCRMRDVPTGATAAA
ncbi:MAG: MFS transporter [Actinocrinis sp.]